MTASSFKIRLCSKPWLASSLAKNHPGSAASLREGLDETLTVIDLGLDVALYRTLCTTNYSTGQLLRVAIQRDGSAAPAAVIQTPRALPTIDGIRIVAPFTSSLFVTENTGALSRIDITGDTSTITTLGTFDQPTSVIRVGRDLWVSEGQDLRLQGVDPTPLNLPFVIRRFSL